MDEGRVTVRCGIAGEGNDYESDNQNEAVPPDSPFTTRKLFWR